MRKGAVSKNKSLWPDVHQYNCWNSETLPSFCAGPLVTHALSWTTISTLLQGNLSHCFPIGCPSVITNHLVFSPLSLSQPLRMMSFQMYIYFSTAVRTGAPHRGQTSRSWAVSGRGEMRSLSFLPCTGAPQLGVLCYNTEIHASASWQVPRGTSCHLGLLPSGRDCCLPCFSCHLP